MIPDGVGRQLHDRATRGKILSEVEKRQLTTWYAEQDAAESEILSLPEESIPSSDLREQIANIIQQLNAVTQNIQALTQENVALRNEIATLRQQVAQQLTPQLA